MTNSVQDFNRIEFVERSACDCLATNKMSHAFPPTPHPQEELWLGDSTKNTPADCLALAEWMGDTDLLKELYWGSDPPSLFGKPSWAAAAQGHLEIVQFFLDEGALPYEKALLDNVEDPFDYTNHLYKSSLVAAAFKGHVNILEMFLQHPLCISQV